MTREEAREYIISHSKDWLKKDNSGKGWICPICGSGTGKKGTGITEYRPGHFTCWAGCYSCSDIIEIIGLQRGLNDYNSRLEAAAAEFGIAIDGKAERPIIITPSQPQPTQEEPQTDYSDFFLQAHKNIGKTDYAQRRGLSQATIDRFNLGYVAEWRSPKAPNAPASPRLIIPTSQYSYLARDTRENLPEIQSKYSKMKVGKVNLFNTDALWQNEQPIYIVEGEIDAMSICEVGGEAVALGSTSNINMLLQILTERKPSQPLIVSLDGDDAGKKSTPKLIQGLRKLGIECTTADIAAESKDANEALCKDREAFAAAVTAAASTGVISSEELREQERQDYSTTAAGYCVDELMAYVNENHAACIPTGYNILDELLGGGLYPGLYIVGAISALGKTTFCTQIADNIAGIRQHDVLIISLEMSRYELIAKSLSRMSMKYDLTDYKTTEHAKSTRDVLSFSSWINNGTEQNAILQKAMSMYREYGKHIYIIEGVGNIGVQEVRERIQRHIDMTGNVPVVLIDYLQILAPADMRATDKQNIDRAVIELKRMSRDFNTPVIAISSFNRDSYKGEVTMAAFKESGAVEYSADVAMALTYADYSNRDAQPREVILSVLKNRNGTTGEIMYNFYSTFNTFRENPMR